MASGVQSRHNQGHQGQPASFGEGGVDNQTGLCESQHRQVSTGGKRLDEHGQYAQLSRRTRNIEVYASPIVGSRAVEAFVKPRLHARPEVPDLSWHNSASVITPAILRSATVKRFPST